MNKRAVYWPLEYSPAVLREKVFAVSDHIQNSEISNKALEKRDAKTNPNKS